MTELNIHNAYKSWRNTIVKDCNASHRTIQSTDGLYEELFPKHEEYIRAKREEILKAIWKENADEIYRRKWERADTGRKRSNGFQ